MLSKMAAARMQSTASSQRSWSAKRTPVRLMQSDPIVSVLGNMRPREGDFPCFFRRKKGARFLSGMRFLRKPRHHGLSRDHGLPLFHRQNGSCGKIHFNTASKADNAHSLAEF